MGKIDGLAALTQLQTLDCSKNSFNYIAGLSSLTKLETLLCNGCPINSLDISALSALKRLDCSHIAASTDMLAYDRLSELTVTKNPALEYLKCNFNKIGALDLQNNPLIKELDCGNNKIMGLTLAETTNFTYFACNNNLIITNINLTGNRTVIAKGGESALFVGNQQYFNPDWGWYRMTVFISSDQAKYDLTEATNFGRNVLAEQIDNGALRVGSFYYEGGTWSYLLDKSKTCIGVVYEVNQARNGGKAVGLQTPPANWKGLGYNEGMLVTFKGLLVEAGAPPSTINESGRVNYEYNYNRYGEDELFMGGVPCFLVGSGYEWL